MQSQIIWFIIIISIFFYIIMIWLQLLPSRPACLDVTLKTKTTPLLILLERIEQNRIILRIISISR